MKDKEMQGNGVGPDVSRDVAGVKTRPRQQVASLGDRIALRGPVPLADYPEDPELWPARWKARFDAAILCETSGILLSAELTAGITKQLWKRLVDDRGRPFETFKAFCEAPRPQGLGTPHEVVNALLTKKWGGRRVRLMTTPRSRQGQRDTSGHGGPKSATRTEKRDRAIERAPAAIQQLYTQELLGVREAGRAGSLARSDPSDPRLTLAAKFAGEVLGKVQQDAPTAAQKKEISRQMGTILGVPPTVAAPASKTADSVYQDFLDLPPAEQTRFRRRFAAEQSRPETKASGKNRSGRPRRKQVTSSSSGRTPIVRFPTADEILAEPDQAR